MLGGVTVETTHLVEGLRARGHDVALVSDRPLLDMSARHFPFTLASRPAMRQQLLNALEVFKPEVIQIIFAFSASLLLFASVLRGRPWLVTCHSVPPSEWSLGAFHGQEWLHYGVRALRYLPQTWRALMLYAGRMPPRVIVHSEVIARAVASRLYPRNRIVVIRFGQLAPKAGAGRRAEVLDASSPRLVTVSGITHTKGYHDALCALPKVIKRHPNLRYDIYGQNRDPSYVSYLQALVREMHLERHVNFHFSAGQAAIEVALAKADLFVQPSHEEGFCLSYIEAAAVVPRLVGTMTGAMPAISHGDAGMRLVPVASPQTLADAVLELLGATLPEDLMSKRTARFLGDFSWDAYYLAHEKLYRDVALVQTTVDSLA